MKNIKQISELVNNFIPLPIENYYSPVSKKRYDSKFLMPVQLLDSILVDSLDEYNVITVNSKRIQQYKSLYFDNNEFAFYKAHHNGKLNRFKVRLRKYNGVSSTYVEVKFKNNKLQTQKWRKSVNSDAMAPSIISDHRENFVELHTGDMWGILSPKVFIDYSRITLIPKSDRAERITIDFNLLCSFGDTSADLKDVVIVEIKQKKVDVKTKFFKIMKERDTYQTRFSKYCFGINHLYPHLKHNKFKPRNLRIDKLETGSNFV